MKRIALFAIAVIVLAGCLGRTSDPIDPIATYDAYGAQMTPEEAVPVVAVAADRPNYVGKQVKVEGVVVEVCQNMGCWLTMSTGEGSLLRIDVPRDSTGAYAYTFPTDISGRRIIVGGMLAEGPDAAHDHGDHDAGDAEAHGEAEAAAMSVDLALVAQGALVERVRTESPSE